MAKQSTRVRKRLDALRWLGGVAAVMLDGEEAGRILEPDTVRYIRQHDSKQGFLSLDHFVVDHGPFLRTKKMLQRLAMLVDFPVGICLWFRLEGVEGQVTPLVQNGRMGRYYRFGCQTVDRTAEMDACLDRGEIVTAPEDHPSRTLTVLVPVEDSLGDVVGFLELTTENPVTSTVVPGYD
jgi:hypothetical protein